jgi:PAS domain S-box-containing protein
LFVKHAPAGIAMFDDKMRYLAVSRRFISDCGLPSDAEIIGRSHYKILPDIPLRWRELHARVLAGEELSHEEDPYPRQDGRIDRVQWSMKPWRRADGRIGGAMLFCQFVTRALAEREARFQATFENAAVGIAHVAPDGRWLRVNEALCRILDYPADELVTKSLQDISYPHDDLAADLAAHKRMLDGEINSYQTDRRFLRKDGAIVWVRLTIGCVRERDGSIDYFVDVVEDISARRRAEQELAKSEERFRTSVLHSPVPTFLYNDREQMLAVSGSWLKAAGGVSAGDFHQIEDWTNYFFDGGKRSREALEFMREIIATEPEMRTDEFTLTFGGEKRIWNFVNSALGTQSDGRRLFITVAQDVTDRRIYEERIDLLMREARHRTKNILSLVQVIARQTAAGEGQDFIDRFSKRIQALAANQDLLVRHAWQRIDVNDLVRVQLGHFADLIGTRINFDGPKLRLNAAAAQAIGLAIHELATNAGKYGALSTDAGRVDVSWQLDDDTYTMGWTERSGPPVRPPERRGFGSTVIESMVERTLGCEVQLDYALTGLQWHLTCRAADALERGG